LWLSACRAKVFPAIFDKVKKWYRPLHYTGGAYTT